MTFDDKVKFLRTLPQFKVIPISEVRAVAFAITEKTEVSPDDIIIPQTAQKILITLTQNDAAKIVREYPNLASALTVV